MWIKTKELKEINEIIEKLKEDVLNLTIENDLLKKSNDVEKLKEDVLNLTIENKLLRELLVVNKIDVKLRK